MRSPRDASLIQRVVEEIWNAGDVELADELFGANYINHGGLIPDFVRGPEAVKFSVILYRTAFPGLYLCVDDLSADRGALTLRWTAWGRSRSGADSSQLAQKGGGGALSGTTKVSVSDGQVVESWTDWGSASVLQYRTSFQPSDDETS